MSEVIDAPVSLLLKAACDRAYGLHPKSCSHAVWSVIKAMHNPDEPYRVANDLIKHLASAWAEVTVDRGHELAVGGIVVVGGMSGSSNGHVIVIYPGSKIDSGGYDYPYQGKILKMRSHGKYPACMSTSIGSWPGAMSKGDKTVWDPWGNDAKFQQVKFWTPKVDGAAAGAGT
jgi:hypothetical protein